MTAPTFVHHEFGHGLSRAVWEALQTAGWALTASSFPGNAIYSHPLSGTEKPTPEFIPAQWWGGETYSSLRQLTFNYNNRRITKLWTRECPAPWVMASMRPVSFKRAIEYVGEEWGG